MADTHETSADIIAEMQRRIAVKMSDAWYTQEEWRKLCDRGATESEVYDRDNHEVRWYEVCAAVCPLARNDHLVICKHFKELPL